MFHPASGCTVRHADLPGSDHHQRYPYAPDGRADLYPEDPAGISRHDHCHSQRLPGKGRTGCSGHGTVSGAEQDAEAFRIPAAIQNFSHIMLVLHRQLGMEIPDAVFRELESCHSLQELCALLQDCIVKNLQRRRALNEQGTVRIIGEITQYIEENLEKDLTLNTIAQQFHFNPSYLSSLFKRQTGTGAERIYDPETDRTG